MTDLSPLEAVQRAVVNRTDAGCWHASRVQPSGYSRIHWRGRDWVGSRLSYLAHNGSLADDLQVDHLCHGADATCAGGATCLHRRCVNPAHLEQVSAVENCRRAPRGFGRGQRLRETCVRGHVFDAANTYWRKSRASHTDGEPTRQCRACDRLRKQVSA